uniref:Uncharacterized protein n=1 Tax=Timema bartmani TaxID=61472 RepID=A0A7R9EZN5_9NEOP|nr:unnamed protein product [Timema bartmani]
MTPLNSGGLSARHLYIQEVTVHGSSTIRRSQCTAPLQSGGLSARILYNQEVSVHSSSTFRRSQCMAPLQSGGLSARILYNQEVSVHGSSTIRRSQCTAPLHSGGHSAWHLYNQEVSAHGSSTIRRSQCTAPLNSGGLSARHLYIQEVSVKRGLKLRRFRSEVSVSEDKRTVNGKPSAVSSVTMEPSGGGESDATELLQLDLSHAVSQPNILEASPSLRPRRPHELKVVSPARPDRYSGVEGKVVQAQGLHVAHVAQLYCRVKLHLGLSTSDKMGRSLAKSRFLPAVPNPQFDLPFQVDAPESVPRQAALSFEVRSPGKEVLGSCRATLQELLAATSPDSNQVHTWLSLNNGASLEVMVAHGRELKKSGRKIFRSWSVHRIGKI